VSIPIWGSPRECGFVCLKPGFYLELSAPFLGYPLKLASEFAVPYRPESDKSHNLACSGMTQLLRKQGVTLDAVPAKNS
jgi:hypothetical protein